MGQSRCRSLTLAIKVSYSQVTVDIGHYPLSKGKLLTGHSKRRSITVAMKVSCSHVIIIIINVGHYP